MLTTFCKGVVLGVGFGCGLALMFVVATVTIDTIESVSWEIKKWWKRRVK